MTPQELMQRRDKLQEEIRIINTVLDGLRKLCDHEWKDDGHDSHYSFEKCAKCGAETKT